MNGLQHAPDHTAEFRMGDVSGFRQFSDFKVIQDRPEALP